MSSSLPSESDTDPKTFSSLPTELQQHVWTFCCSHADAARDLARLRRTYKAAHTQVDGLAQDCWLRLASDLQTLVAKHLPEFDSRPQHTQYRLRLLAAVDDERLLQEVWVLRGWDIDLNHDFSSLFHDEAGQHVAHTIISPCRFIPFAPAPPPAFPADDCDTIEECITAAERCGKLAFYYQHQGLHGRGQEIMSYFEDALFEATNRHTRLDLREACGHRRGWIASRYSAEGELLPVLFHGPPPPAWWDHFRQRGLQPPF